MQLKIVASAAALALCFVAIASAVPGQDAEQDVVHAYATMMANIENVRVHEPEPQYKPHGHTWAVEQERLVEGHTTFVVLETTSSEEHEAVEGSINVTGLVHCEAYADVPTRPWNGLPWITGVDRAGFECTGDVWVIITPRAYCQVRDDWECTTSDPPTLPTMSPTGRVTPFTSPTGQRAYLEEYSYEAPAEDGLPMTYYAWAVPLLTPWVNEHGEPQNLLAPVPRDAYETMGVRDFVPLWADQVPRDA